MAERSPIFSAKVDNQRIGYIEGGEAFDLLGNKRCNYNQSTGNLLELGRGKTIGHVSLAGYFVGSSWIADELFPQLVAKNSPTTPPDKPGTAGSAGLGTSPEKVVTVQCIALVISPDDAVAADLTASVTSPDKVVSVEPALVTSPRKPVTSDPIASATSFDEANAANSTALTASSDEPTAAGPAASFKAFSQESTAVEPAALLTSSMEDTAAADYTACAASLDEPAVAQQTKILPSIDVERQLLEMIQMTLAMKSIKPKPQTVKDVATRMREHLAGLRRQRPRARMVKKADLMQIRQGQARD
jgi:hypothetical protein